MKIAINRSHVNKQPSDAGPEWWRAYNGAFENEEIDAADVLMFARYGWGYCAQVNGYRKVANFAAAQHLDLDFDDGSRNIWQLAEDPFIARWASFLYETASSTADHPKVRVFFELDRPVANAQKYRLLRDSLLARYPAADRAHVDACRFAFGSRDCRYIWLGNVLDLETAAAELVQPYQAEISQKSAKNQQKKERKQPLKPVPTAVGGVSQRFLDNKLDYLLKRVENALDGEKYRTLRATAVTLGGYVKAGYYSEAEMREALGDAIRANNGNVKSLEVADKCIDDGLAWGMKKALYITGDQYKTLGQAAAAL